MGSHHYLFNDAIGLELVLYYPFAQDFTIDPRDFTLFFSCRVFNTSFVVALYVLYYV